LSVLYFRIQWREDQGKMEQQGHAILDALQKATAAMNERDQALPGMGVVSKCLSQLSNGYDSELGGFNKAPKFPQPGKQVL